MDEEIELQVDQPLEWVKEHIELGVEFNFDQFANVIIENVDVFCKIIKTDLISEFQKLDLEFIKDFRIELIGCCKSL